MHPTTLEGPRIRLEPLTLDHLHALESIAFDPSIWRYMLTNVRTPADLRAWVQSALDAQSVGTALPWVTINKNTNAPVGSTRFMDYDARHRTVEIGNTWLAASARGTRINTEAKLLQLTYAFETLDLLRVAFKTHHENQRSQAAIRALGATYEGTFRHHYLMPDGSHRNTVWFSILREEWPSIKTQLTRRLNSRT